MFPSELGMILDHFFLRHRYLYRDTDRFTRAGGCLKPVGKDQVRRTVPHPNNTVQTPMCNKTTFRKFGPRQTDEITSLALQTKRTQKPQHLNTATGKMGSIKWKPYKELFRVMYVDQQKPLDEIVEYFRTEHNFTPG